MTIISAASMFKKNQLPAARQPPRLPLHFLHQISISTPYTADIPASAAAAESSAAFLRIRLPNEVPA
ncbi:MAG TPA: hypothetical protein VLV89_08115 [Candidatus Acidoferrum sp.]|nr:hypothetical protein [Candidatus Acidoferrum sp.]